MVYVSWGKLYTVSLAGLICKALLADRDDADDDHGDCDNCFLGASPDDS